MFGAGEGIRILHSLRTNYNTQRF